MVSVFLLLLLVLQAAQNRGLLPGDKPLDGHKIWYFYMYLCLSLIYLKKRTDDTSLISYKQIGVHILLLTYMYTPF